MRHECLHSLDSSRFLRDLCPFDLVFCSSTPFFSYMPARISRAIWRFPICLRCLVDIFAWYEQSGLSPAVAMYLL